MTSSRPLPRVPRTSCSVCANPADVHLTFDDPAIGEDGAYCRVHARVFDPSDLQRAGTEAVKVVRAEAVPR